VGTRFTTSGPGALWGIRFYKGTENTGEHTVKLWDVDGNLLAQALATGETAEGWQTVAFPSPVALTPGVTYYATYQAPNGHYAVTSGALADVRTAGPLVTPTRGGVYGYGDGTAFPNDWSTAWYGVDVVFVPEAAYIPEE